MKKGLFILFMTITFIACKSDKNNENFEVNKTDTELVLPNSDTKNFEDSLLDYRDINESFLENYKVEKFGIQKTNDSLIGFVFKLNDDTLNETVLAYSMAILIYDRTLEKPQHFSFNPKIKEIGNSKFIIENKVLNNMTYFDSLDLYIYKRRDYKSSGKLGSFRIRDILFK